MGEDEQGHDSPWSFPSRASFVKKSRKDLGQKITDENSVLIWGDSCSPSRTPSSFACWMKARLRKSYGHPADEGQRIA